MGWAAKKVNGTKEFQRRPPHRRRPPTADNVNDMNVKNPTKKSETSSGEPIKKVHNVFHALVMILSIKFGTMVEIVWLLCGEIKIASERTHHDEEVSWEKKA